MAYRIKKLPYLLILSICFILLLPQYSQAIYGVGDYTFNIEHFDKKLQKLLYNVNLQGKEKTLYFNLSSLLEVSNKKINMPNKHLSIYNKLHELQVGDISVDMNQSINNLLGAKSAITKKVKGERINSIFFTGKSSDEYITGIKINKDQGTITSHSLFLLNKSGMENKQVFGGSFKAPIHKSSVLMGEWSLDTKNNTAFLINNLFEHKKISMMTEYSRINEIDTVKLKSDYKTKKATLSSAYSQVDKGWGIKLEGDYKTDKVAVETEYSNVNHAGCWKLTNSYKINNFCVKGSKTDNLFVGGSIYKKEAGYYSEVKPTTANLPLSKKISQYSGYMGYEYNWLNKFPLSISYNYSYTNLPDEPSKEYKNAILYKMTYFDLKSQTFISTLLGLELTKQQKNTSCNYKWSFKKGIRLSTMYYGVKPYVDYEITDTGNKLPYNSNREQTTRLSYGIKKDITRNLSTEFRYYQIAPQSKTISTTKYLTMNYKCSKIPITLVTKTSWLNNKKPSWDVLITYKKDTKKDTFNYQNETMKYTSANKIKFGKYPEDITSLTTEIPTREELSILGNLKIKVFEDKDFDDVFSEKKDIPIKALKIKLDKILTTTNEEGNAGFVEIPPGTYTLSLDLSNLPVNLVPKIPYEQEIKIQPGEDIQLNFPIISTAKGIKGGVFIDENRNGIWDEEEKGVEDVVVYANEKPTYTNSKGMYRFMNIIPGTVTVRIDIKSLPENFEMTTKEKLEIKISPKEEIKNINFGIAEIEPEIEFE